MKKRCFLNGTERIHDVRARFWTMLVVRKTGGREDVDLRACEVGNPSVLRWCTVKK
jgi:hypothetical protein